MSMRDCGETFKAAVSQGRGIRSHMGGVMAKMTGNDASGFFTPSDNSPFAALDDDKPSFMIGCNIPKFTNSAHGAANTIHMYVWDRGSHRDVEFASPHSMMGGASSAKLVRKVITSFQQADPNLAVLSAP